MASRILVTGSNGLIGSEVCLFFGHRGFQVHGLDNNQRAVFFGPQGDTRWNQRRLQDNLAEFTHHELDIRNRAGLGIRSRPARAPRSATDASDTSVAG